MEHFNSANLNSAVPKHITHEELVNLSSNESKFSKKTGILHIMYKEQVERHDVEFATKKAPSSSNNILQDSCAVVSLLSMKTKILPEHVHTAMENQSKMDVAQHQQDVFNDKVEKSDIVERKKWEGN